MRIVDPIPSWRLRRRSQPRIGCCRLWMTWRFCPGKILHLYFDSAPFGSFSTDPATLAGPGVLRGMSVSLAALAANFCYVLMCLTVRELIEMLALSRTQKLPQPGEDAQVRPPQHLLILQWSALIWLLVSSSSLL